MKHFGLAVLLTIVPMGANALLLEAGESATFNIDMTSAIPAPPYDIVVTQAAVTGGVADFLVFTGLNGGGANVGAATAGGVVYNFALPGILDGVFSWVISNPNASAITIATIVAQGRAGDVFTDPIFGVAVPEPSPLALLAAAFLAFGMVSLGRRRVPVKLGDRQPAAC